MWLPYEFHLSFDPACLKELNQFMYGHKSIRVHHFHNLIRGGGHIEDLVTAEESVHYSAYRARRYLEKIANDFINAGFAVRRRKMETVPWHHHAQDHIRKHNSYFETHLHVFGDINCLFNTKLLLSRNALSKCYIATLRTYEDYNHHLEQLHIETMQLPFKGIVVASKIETEFAIYDSNPGHDAEWIR